MIRAVFFDVGNTLFFYNYKFLSELLLERFDIDRDPRELEAIHYSLKETIQEMAREGKNYKDMVEAVYSLWLKELDVDEEKIPRVIEIVKSHPFPHLFWSQMGDGVKETLEWFKERRFKMGVISNASGQIKRLLEHTGIDHYFDVVLDSHEVGVEKPDERIFQKALEALGVEPHEAVHVGDLLESDMRGASKVGIVPILVDRENRYPEIDCMRVSHVHEVTGLPIFQESK
jgi:putative hydrolase of the HAD superfamily